MGYIGLCGLKGYGFSAILLKNGVSILAILVLNGVWFFHPNLMPWSNGLASSREQPQVEFA